MVFAVLVTLIVAGYFIWPQLKPRSTYEFNPATFPFLDHAESNTPLGGCDVGSLHFLSIAGQPVDLRQFLGQKNVVLVVTRGNTSGTGPGPYYRKFVCTVPRRRRV